MVHVKYIASRRNPALWETFMTSMQEVAEASMEQASTNPEPDASGDSESLDLGQFEEVATQILSSFSTHSNWRETVSYSNKYGQTLPHLAIPLGYTRLLEKLISWGINLSVRDATGATALHFAYLYNQPNCVSLITEHRVETHIHDEPSRNPSAMNLPGGSEASFDGILYASSDLESERAGSTKRIEESLRAREKGIFVEEWLRENNQFDLGPASLFECGANSFELGNLDDQSPQPAATDLTDTEAPLTPLDSMISSGDLPSTVLQENIAMLPDRQTDVRYLPSNCSLPT
jgi:hypothetical protein